MKPNANLAQSLREENLSKLKIDQGEYTEKPNRKLEKVQVYDYYSHRNTKDESEWMGLNENSLGLK